MTTYCSAYSCSLPPPLPLGERCGVCATESDAPAVAELQAHRSLLQATHPILSVNNVRSSCRPLLYLNVCNMEDWLLKGLTIHGSGISVEAGICCINVKAAQLSHLLQPSRQWLVYVVPNNKYFPYVWPELLSQIVFHYLYHFREKHHNIPTSTDARSLSRGGCCSCCSCNQV